MYFGDMKKVSWSSESRHRVQSGKHVAVLQLNCKTRANIATVLEMLQNQAEVTDVNASYRQKS